MGIKYDIRENGGSFYFSPTDKPAFVILRSIDDGPWLAFSGGYSRDFCQRAIDLFAAADSVISAKAS